MYFLVVGFSLTFLALLMATLILSFIMNVKSESIHSSIQKNVKSKANFYVKKTEIRKPLFLKEN